MKSVRGWVGPLTKQGGQGVEGGSLDQVDGDEEKPVSVTCTFVGEGWKRWVGIPRLLR